MKVSLLKTAAKGLIVGASVLAFAGAAGATTTINLYGASAQTNFWNGAAADLLHVEFGCAAGAVTTASPTDSKSKVTHGTGCSSTYDNSDGDGHNGIINFSYSNQASWDGIESVNEVWDTTGNNGSAAQPCSQGQNYRKVATCMNAGCTTVASSCQPITIGTSDVEAGAFSQLSSGYQYGPLTGGITNLSRAFFLADGITPGIDTSHLNPPSTPIAYPFGFYVSPGVTSTRCNSSAGIPAGAADNSSVVGQLCLTTDNTACAGVPSACEAQTIDNLTRLQVVALFSGVIKNWDEFGVYYPNLPVTLCMRHAGSGTSATLDLGIMEGNGWGTGLVQNEQPVTGSSQPYVYFNDGTGDAQNCLEWVGGQSFSNARTSVPSNVKNGGIGYWDADAGPYYGPSGTASAPTPGAYAGPIKFNGVLPSRITMHDGLYDNFWTINRMYVNPGAITTTQLNMFNEIVTYLDNPANVTTALASGNKGLFYGASSELNFNKGASITYPYVYAPASSPANPD